MKLKPDVTLHQSVAVVQEAFRSKESDVYMTCGMKPRIDRTTFGSITIEGTVFEHDVIIRLTGRPEKRKKKLSKAIYGTSHMISLTARATRPGMSLHSSLVISSPFHRDTPRG
jgi:hypothetical protein